SELGADAVRAYLMFVAPWEQGGEWNDSGLSGISRWLNRLWNMVLSGYSQDTPGLVMKRLESELVDIEQAQRGLLRITHQTIRKVTEDLEKIRFNTMIAALMEFTNYLTKVKEAGAVNDSGWRETTAILLKLLAPTAPHLAEELWQRTGHDYSIHNQSWPQWNEELAKDEQITLVIQVNGKLRDRITVPALITEFEAMKLAYGSQRVMAYLGGKPWIKNIYVPGRLINIVVRDKD
ncbi:unnamed protein product, partial [marine sediment metagenome]